MPIYEFYCKKCNSRFENFLLSYKDIVDLKCPKCGSGEIQKLLSGFNCGCATTGAGSLTTGSGCGTSSRFG